MVKTAEKETVAKKTAAKKTVAKKAPVAKKSEGKTIIVEQIGSTIGILDKQIATLRGLGLHRMHQRRELEDTPSVRGMINKLKHLVKIV